MNKNYLSTEKGLSLIELLAALVIVGTITILVMNYLLSGMDSYQKVSDDVSMNNEANYIMTVFTNEIYVATYVLSPEGEPLESIDLENLDGEVVTIGFFDEKAYIKENYGERDYMTSDRYTYEDSTLEYIEESNLIDITLIVKDKQGDRRELTLQSHVSIGKEKEEAKEGENHEIE